MVYLLKNNFYNICGLKKTVSFHTFCVHTYPVFVVEKDEVQEQTSQLWNGEERAWYKFWNDYRDWYGEGEGYGRGAASYDDWYGEGEGGTQPLNIRFGANRFIRIYIVETSRECNN